MKKIELLKAAMKMMDAINRGDAICKECDEIMERTTDSESGCDIWICPSCGCTISNESWVAEQESKKRDENAIPYGCMACGGPYPDCKTVCELFED